jgi:hypothetical protein
MEGGRMAKWELPPIAKVYEALSAVADGRVTITGETNAQVVSSARDKTYTVKWSPDFRQITANDNASRWQGYIGYPIIAVLLFLKRIDYAPDAAKALANVPWNELNKQYRRDYDRAIDHALKNVADPDAIRVEAQRIFDQLAELELEKLTGRGHLE